MPTFHREGENEPCREVVLVETPPGAVLWQRAAKLAARFHRYQLRKDGETPYVAHPFRVALTLANLFRIDDPVALAAGLLHDVLEDTAGDFDDIEAVCGTEVACLVAALSKDSRRRDGERDEAYKKQIASAADWRVRLVKLADIYDNLCDARESNLKTSARHWARWALDLVEHEERLGLAVSLLSDKLAEASS